MRDINPPGSISIPVKLTYEGGVYDNNVSELYDGVYSLDGFSRILHIVAHAYVNEEVIKHSTALKGAKIYRVKSHKGSFVDVINVVLEHPIETMTMKLVYDGFYDFLKFAAGKAVGKTYTPKNRRAKRLSRQEPFISSLEKSLKAPVRDAHRPIRKDSNVKVSIGSERKKILVYDLSTYEYISDENFLDMEYDLLCNVTKMNVLSPHGRLYLDEVRGTVTFEAIEEEVGLQGGMILSHSLNEYKRGGDPKIKVDGRKLVDRNGEILKLYVYNVRFLEGRNLDDE